MFYEYFCVVHTCKGCMLCACASIPYVIIVSTLFLTAPLVLQTEALQVFTALPRFYFPQLSSSWVRMGEVCVTLLTMPREGLQQHLLKVCIRSTTSVMHVFTSRFSILATLSVHTINQYSYAFKPSFIDLHSSILFLLVYTENVRTYKSPKSY